jgi:NAD(P)-dependent dehydrogenase (short-subunit alcohol dehydrogenase family)
MRENTNGKVTLQVLSDKVIIVTGSSSGIGRASAILFAANGAQVVIADVDEERGVQVEREIRKKGGVAIFVKTDVSISSDASNCVNVVVEKFGHLDGLFNNAGINPTGTVMDTSEELWDRVMNTNLKGTFLMSKYSIPKMKDAGGGAIVCTASVDAILAIANEEAYIASKGGIISLVKAMALDFGSTGVRVNCICPGAIRTPLYEKFIRESPNVGIEMPKWHALNRIGEAEEVARVAMFLLSDSASFVSGAIVPVDGGYSAIKT